MNKDNDAFRTISEVADDLDLPKHVLRFWEVKFPQIQPMKRGGGRRYYRPEDLDLLKGIRHLLHAEGYTIKGVQKILREQGIDHVKRASREPSAPARSASAAGTKAAGVAKAAAPRSGRGAAAASVRPLAGPQRQRIQEAVRELEALRDLLKGPLVTAVAQAKPRRAVPSGR